MRLYSRIPSAEKGLRQRSYLYQGAIRVQRTSAICFVRAAGQRENSQPKRVVSSGRFCSSGSRDGHTYLPHSYSHVSRLFGFFVLGQVCDSGNSSGVGSCAVDPWLLSRLSLF